jgi:hypothetical protein
VLQCTLSGVGWAGDRHSLRCVYNSQKPEEGATVITVVCRRDTAGRASITYQGFPGDGLDTVQATAIVNGAALVSNVVTVTWYNEPADTPPVVSAGSDQTITLPQNRAILNGSVSDPAVPLTSLTISWTTVSGPLPAVFDDPTQAVTAATFTAPGAYVLQIGASDGTLTATATVHVTVDPALYPTTASWLALPDRSTVSGVVPINLVDGVTLVSGTLSYAPVSVATIESGRVRGVLGHVKYSGSGTKVVAEPATWRTRCGFGLAEERMKHECGHREHTTARPLPPSCAGPRGPKSSSGRRPPRVPMVETADARQRNQIRAHRLRLNCPAVRPVLGQPIVSPVRVVVSNVLAGQAPDVRLVQRNHAIETVPARSAHPPLRRAVLPRTAHARSHCLDA